MRFHVVGLPTTSTTPEYSFCAYTEKVRRFCDMMMSLGHTVYLYSGPQNTADCTEHIACVDEVSVDLVPSWDAQDPRWTEFAFRAIKAIGERSEPRDFLCIIGGSTQRVIADCLPDLMPVEFGIGYEGTFAFARVFESYAWMHTIYGRDKGAFSADGGLYDIVIPNYFTAAEFPEGDHEGDYLLYVGRMIRRKGLQIVLDVADRLGVPLIMCGKGEDVSMIPEGVDYRPYVNPSERARLMGNAVALLSPTLYVEPFGAVAVEAQLCGTPAITTPFGAFTETVEHDKTGFHCHTLKDFCAAVNGASELDHAYIRHRAMSTYSTDVVRYRYEHYFEMLSDLYKKGWYE